MFYVFSVIINCWHFFLHWISFFGSFVDRISVVEVKASLVISNMHKKYKSSKVSVAELCFKVIMLFRSKFKKFFQTNISTLVMQHEWHITLHVAILHGTLAETSENNCSQKSEWKLRIKKKNTIYWIDHTYFYSP